MVKIDREEEDQEFTRRTVKVYKKIETGEGIRMDFDNFIREMKKWCRSKGHMS